MNVCNSKIDKSELGFDSVVTREEDDPRSAIIESFKCGVLSSIKANYSVAITSNSNVWTFQHQGSGCSVEKTQQSREELVERAKQEAENIGNDSRYGVRLQQRHTIECDTTIYIGPSITEHDIKSWTRASPRFTYPAPDERVGTKDGSMFLDPEYRGKIYLSIYRYTVKN